MANLSYCRFSNTLTDLKDCADYIDEPLSRDEHAARIGLVMACCNVLEALGADLDVHALARAAAALPQSA